jgi:uncharacterized protein
MTMVIDVETPHGTARAHLHPVKQPKASLVLGHGAGGGITAPDLVAATDAAREQGFNVALIEQPYRVARRRAPAPAAHLDAAWTIVVQRLLANELSGLPLVVGGRSLGARVACRTQATLRAVGVLCLAFPLKPPRRSGSAPSQSRLPELEAVSAPMLIVQGTRDPFGMPPAVSGRSVIEVAGNHSLRSDLGSVRAAVSAWLGALVVELAASPHHATP